MGFAVIRKIALKRIDPLGVGVVFGVFGLLAGLFSLAMIAVVARSVPLDSMDYFNIETGLLSLDVISGTPQWVIWSWPGISAAVHFLAGFLPAVLYNLVAGYLVPISIRIETSDHSD